MQELDQNTADDLIRNIDLMARAAYTWVRQQTFEQRFIGLQVSPAEEIDLAAGFLAGLKARMRLETGETILLAYVYALMAGERSTAAETAQQLVNREAAAMQSESGYMYGLRAAREILNERADCLQLNLTTQMAGRLFN
jgi:hypothetical protein